MKELNRYFEICLLILSFTLPSKLFFAQQSNYSPTNISGLILWLKADSGIVLNGSNIAQWNDCSSNHNNATQSTISNQPIIINNAVNGKPTIRFDGINDYLTLSNEINTNNFSFFIVVKPTNAITGSSSAQALFGSTSLSDALSVCFGDGAGALIGETFSMLRLNTSVNPNVHGVGMDDTISNYYHILNGNLFNTTSSENMDGVNRLIYSTGGGLDSSTVFSLKKLSQIGSVASIEYFDGDIAEIIIYDKSLTSTEKQNIENYLRNKYSSPPVNLGADINLTYGFCDTVTLDAGLGFTGYLWSTGATTRIINTIFQGTYSVTVTDVFCNTSTDTIQISFPSFNLNINDTTLCLGNNLNISVSGLANPNNYHYVWFNGLTNISTNNFITANQPGSYWVRISDTLGCPPKNSNTITLSIDSFSNYVTLGNDTSFCSGNSISVYHSTYPIQSYLWNNNSTNSTLIINNTGSYSVTVTNSDGCIKTDTVNVTISGTAPHTQFTGNTVCFGDSTIFINSSFCFFPDTITQWNWDFGDTTISNIQNPNHKYLHSGIHIVKLTATTNSGCSQIFSDTISVNPVSSANFIVNSICINNPFQFINTSSTLNGDRFSWNFGDGSTDTIQNPVHTYLISGNFPVTLTISSINGCTSIKTDTINVISSALIPQQFNLQYPSNGYISSNNIIIFRWNPSINAIRYKIEIASDSIFSNIILNLISDSTKDTIILPNNVTIYWRVKAYNFCNDSVISGFKELTIFSPTNISGLILWLKADSGIVLNGSNVAQWNDCSSNHNNATQSTISNQPVIINNAVNSKPTVRFNGINDYLTLTNEINTNNFSFFIVIKPDSIITGSSSAQALFGSTSLNDALLVGFGDCAGALIGETFSILRYNPSVNPYVHGTAINNNISNCYHILNGNLFDTTSSINLDGINPSIYSTGGGFDSSTIYSLKKFTQIGSLVSQYYFYGDIAEIIIYDKSLTSTEKQNIENYLRNKYSSPPVNLGADINLTYGFCDTVTLDAGLGFTGYLWSTGATTRIINTIFQGTYSVTVTDVFCNTSTDTIQISFPSFNLNINDTTLCLGNNLNISVSGLANPNNYHYVWFNGLTNISTNNFITANQPGSYWVRISDTLGCPPKNSNTITLSIDSFSNYVTLGNDTSFCSGNSISVYHSTYPIQSYLWNNNSTNSTLIINNTGSYSVTVTNSDGCIKTDTVNVTISGTAPHTQFTGNTVCFGDSTIFINSSFCFFPDTITQWNWDFGDTTISNIQNPNHKYLHSGIHIVKLTATTNSGCSQIFSDTISVNPVSSANFIVNSICVNNPFQFINTSSTLNGDRFSWNFGDGSTDTLQNPFHTYLTSGNFIVSLTINSVNGCTSTKTDIINVISSALIPQQFNLQYPSNGYISSNNIIIFRWNPSINAIRYKIEIASDSIFSNIILNLISDSTKDTIILPNNVTIYWRVKAYNFCNDSVISGFKELTIFSPTNISGLILWLKADSGIVLNGSNVAQWNDCSSNHNNATQSTISNQPVIINNAVNSKPTVRFNGINDYLTLTNEINTNNFSFFIVIKPDSIITGSSSAQALFGSTSLNDALLVGFGDCAGALIGETFSILRYNPSVNPYVHGTAINNNISNCYHILNGNLFDTTSSINLDGINPSIYSTGGGFDSSTIYSLKKFTQIGSLVSQYYFYGDIAEIIIYDKSLTSTEKQNIENYLRNKYSSPPVNLGADINLTYGFCDTVTLDAGLGFTGYLWSTGATTRIINTIFQGTYSVTVTDVFCNTSTDTIQISFPSFNLNINDTTLCLGNNLNISVSGLANPNNYHYVWFNGLTNISTNNFITANQPGSYWVRISDTLGCPPKNSNTITLSIDSFSNYVTLGNDTSFCSGNSISVYHSTYPIQSYLWNNNSTNSTLIINNTGSYSVTVTNSDGCIKTDTVNVTISGTAPHTQFTGNTVCFGDSTIFINSSFCFFPDTITQWNWDFGDTTISNIQNPNHKYLHSGIHIVKLTATTNSGCSQIFSDTISVNPVSSANFIVNSICVNNPFQFINTSSTLNGDRFSWNFGDGSTDTIQNPVHTYLISGNFPVTLTISSINGCTSIKTDTINVISSALIPQQFNLQYPSNGYISSNNIIIFRWNPSINAIRYKIEIASDSIFSNIILNLISDSTKDTIILPNNVTIYWRVKAYNFCNDSVISGFKELTIFSPTNISGLILWLKADSGIVLNGSNVAQWNDCSSNHNNATQSTISNQPVIINNAVNSKPTVRFNGINDYLTLTNEINTNNFSFFIVIKPDSIITGSSSAQALFGSTSLSDALSVCFGDGASTLIGETFSMLRLNTSVSPNVHGVGMDDTISNYYHILNGNLFNTTSSENIDGVNRLIYSTGGGLDSSTVFSLKKFSQIGSVASIEYFDGDIAEIIIYDKCLTTSELQNVEEYLRFKYSSAPVNLGPDVNYGFCDSILDAGKRFSSYLWSTGDTTHSIKITTSGYYWVSVTDAFGKISRDTIKIIHPSRILNINDTTICSGNSISITPNNISQKNLYNYLWSNGSTDSLITVNQQGFYWVKISDTIGCFRFSDTSVISVDSFSVKMTLGNDTTLCSGNFLYIKNPTTPVQSYLWSDGSTDSTLVLFNSGTYWLNAKSVNGCKATDSVYIIIHGIAPKVNFNADSFCIGSNTYFYDSSYTLDGSHIISYKWNFGEGNYSNAKNSINNFPAKGIYPVTLIVSTDSLCSNSYTKNITIHSLPVPDFSSSGLCDQSNITFFNTSIPLDVNISSGKWEFSDGFISTDTNVVHFFDSSGTYRIKLIVKSQFGCSDSVSKNIFIKPSPLTDFSFSSPCFGKIIYFSDKTSSSDLFPIIQWTWSFGDSLFSNNSSPDHLYDTSGSYLVKLTTKSLNGCSKSTEKNIIVTHSPVANFGSLNGCVDNNHLMTDSSICVDNNISSWQWSVNNVYSSALKEPVFKFNDTGNYHIRLIVSTSNGCSDTTDKILIIHQNPFVNFDCLPSFGAIPLEINFENKSDANNYLWDFGDGYISNLNNPYHLYVDSGHYTVKLISTNQFGCIDSLSKLIIAVVPLHDIAVLNVKTNIENNYISVSADIANFGTLPEDKINLFMNFEGGNMIKEIWNGNLLSGQIITYKFFSLFEITENKFPSFVCVNAELIDNIDNVPANNENCYIFNNSFSVFNPYPDPTTSFINIEFVIPYEGNAEIKLFNDEGEIIKTIFTGSIKAGFNRVIFDVSDLKSGAYKYQIIFNDKEKSKQFIKN